MIKKTVTYTDYNGNERTEEFRFNLNRNELLKLQSKYPEGFDKRMQKIVTDNDAEAMLNVFEDLLLSSFGIKSEDGSRFDKSKEISEAFKSSPAYDIIFMELANNEEEASNFINGIIPANLRK